MHIELKEEFRADLRPWLADVVVAPKHQKQGIGKMLVDVAVRQAKERGFNKLYLFLLIQQYLNTTSALDGVKYVCMDEFQSHPVTVMEVEL